MVTILPLPALLPLSTGLLGSLVYLGLGHAHYTTREGIEALKRGWLGWLGVHS